MIPSFALKNVETKIIAVGAPCSATPPQNAGGFVHKTFCGRIRQRLVANQSGESAKIFGGMAPVSKGAINRAPTSRNDGCNIVVALLVALHCASSLFVVPSLWAENLPPLPKGPLLLTSVTQEQLSPEYWINRLPDPNKPIKTPEQLKRFNEEIDAMIPERVDIFKLPAKQSGKQIRDQLEFEYTTVKGRILFGVDNKRISSSLFEENIKPLVQWSEVPNQVDVKWGVATRSTSVRALPTMVKMLEEIGDIEFDQLQFTLIKLWTPVAILHVSSDRKWCYLQAPYVRGWVWAGDIAIFPSREELRKLAKADDFLAVTGDDIPIFLDRSFKNRQLEASMGSILPLSGKTDTAYVVWMPLRRADGRVILRRSYVKLGSDVSRRFLTLTQANVIRQAFKLVGARYGWGGMYNGRDCSGFIHDVFLSLGVDMPRDSEQQAFVGTQLGHFEPFQDGAGKRQALRSGTPALTLLRMPLHLMLYLGEVNGQFYVIHSTWAERVSMTSDEKVRINQVVVSDLSLNGRSYVGSLFDRVISINEVN